MCLWNTNARGNSKKLIWIFLDKGHSNGQEVIVVSWNMLYLIMHAKFERSISYRSQVIAKVKVLDM